MAHTGTILESSLSSANQLALSINNIVRGMPRSYTDKTEKVYKIIQTIHALPPLIDNNGLISSYFIVDFDTDVIIKPSVGYLKTHDFYSATVGAGIPDYANWHNFLQGSPNMSLRTYPAESGAYTLYYSYPIVSSNHALKPARIIYFVFDAVKLQGLIDLLSENGIEQLYLVSNSGEQVSLFGSNLSESPDLSLENVRKQTTLLQSRPLTDRKPSRLSGSAICSPWWL